MNLSLSETANKRLLLFTRSLDIGGAERQLALLARALHDQGVDVRVLTFYAGGSLVGELTAAGVPVENLNKQGRWDLLPFLWRLYRRLRRLRPAVLYSWLPMANVLAVVVGKLAGVPRIVWGVRASNMDLEQYDWLSRLEFRLARAVAPLADRIICNSRAGRDFHRVLGFPADRMVVIGNGIDTEVFRPDPEGAATLKREWGIRKGQKVIGLVGRLDPMKDHQTFLQAAALLCRHRTDVRFVCVGDGPQVYRKRLQQLADRLALDRYLVWTGVRSDLPAVYSAFDVACSSSCSEGFSNVIAEAMACQCACVVTDVGDSRLIVGEAGRVVPPRDPEALFRAWMELLEMNDLTRKELGRRARMRVDNEFGIETMTQRTAEALGLCMK